MPFYCVKCNKVEVGPDEVYCPFCSAVERRKKKAWVAYVLWFFLWPFCLHCYYLGSYRQAIGRGLAYVIAVSLAVLTGGHWLIFVLLVALGVWTLVDAFVFIPRSLERIEKNVEEEVRRKLSIP